MLKNEMQLDGIFQIQIHPIPKRTEALEHERFAAAMRTQALQENTCPQPEEMGSADGAEEELLARIQRIEEKLDRLLNLRLLQDEPREKLLEIWTTLSETQVDLRFEPGSVCELAVGKLVRLKWVLPHLPQRLFEGLARVRKRTFSQENWILFHLDFEVIHDETRDEIARAAFLSQRLSRRRSSASHQA
jgi:hypothetical protein